MHVLRINKTCFVPRGQLSKCRYMQKYCFITFLKSITKSLCLAKYQNGHPNFVLVFFLSILRKFRPNFDILFRKMLRNSSQFIPSSFQKVISVFLSITSSWLRNCIEKKIWKIDNNFKIFAKFALSFSKECAKFCWFKCAN